MAITQKIIDLDTTEYASEHEWACHTKGIWMNMLNGIRWDKDRERFIAAPIKYSDTNLEGEKIKFASGQEMMVIFSCLAMDYANKQETRDAWNAAAQKLKEGYLEQQQIEAYVKSTNTDLKKLRKSGQLLEKHELDEEK